MLEGVLPLGHPTGACSLASRALSCQALLLLVLRSQDADAWSLPVPKGLPLLELHVKWPGLHKQWLQLSIPERGWGATEGSQEELGQAPNTGTAPGAMAEQVTIPREGNKYICISIFLLSICLSSYLSI